MSTDPVRGNPGNPQSWNRYTYALNNPMRFTDPHGEAAKDVADDIDETVDNFVELIDDNTSEGFLGTPLNDIAVGLGLMVSGAADMLRVGDATGTVIGTGGDFHDAAMATSQDVARGSALFVSLGSIATPLVPKAQGLGTNPFKGKTPQQIDEMFTAKGFQPRGPDPLGGKGGYVNPETGRSYHIDPGGKYKKGVERPHVDVNRPSGSRLPKRKYPL